MEHKANYHHGNLRAALLEAALAILIESGGEGLTLRGVARRAGVSPSAPYNHFKDKQAILTELANDRRQRAGEAFAKAVAAEATPRAKLRALGVAYVSYALKHPSEFRLMFGGLLHTHISESESEDIPILNLFKNLVREGDNRLSAAEADAAAVAAWSLAHGLAQLLIDGPLRGRSKDPGQVANLVERVIEGSTVDQQRQGSL